MALIELETWIEAPIERVFDLARSVDAHMASTEGTGEKAIAGRTSGLIGAGEWVRWRARHFGVTQCLTVRITAFDRPNAFEDEMTRGAFSEMRHRHRFVEQDGGTLMRDEFYFTAPLGVLGRMAERWFLVRYMTGFLKRRGRALKALAESDGWEKYVRD